MNMPASSLFDFPGRHLQHTAAARDQNDVGAHTGEGQRHPPADAGGRAGHQRHPPFQRKDVERRRGHESHSTDVAGLMPGKYLRRRASAVRACASMPSSREMRAVTAATWRQASRAIRCVVTTFRNLCTERPPV